MFAMPVRETLAGSVPLSSTCHHGAEICYKHYHLTDAPFFVILILSTTLSFVETKPMVSPATYVYKGIICVKCPAGTRVSEHCTESFHNSTCTACEPGTYQALQHTNLETCGMCDKGCQDVNAVVVDNCTADHNLRCQCDDGYYNKHHAQGIMACVRFSKCQPGQTLIDKGGPRMDVVCDWCSRGQFYNVTIDHCSNCTVCADRSLTTLVICTREADTVCSQELTTDSPVSPVPSRSDILDSTTIAILSVTGGLLAMATLLYVIYRLRKRKNSNNARTRRKPWKNSPDQVEEEPFLDMSKWPRPVFLYLSQNVRHWEMFIRHLPFKDNDFDADREMENTIGLEVDERIYRALTKWFESCFNAVSFNSICSALEESKNSKLTGNVVEVYNKAMKSADKPDTDSAGTVSEDTAPEEVIALSSNHGNDTIPDEQQQSKCQEQAIVCQEDTDMSTSRADQTIVVG